MIVLGTAEEAAPSVRPTSVADAQIAIRTAAEAGQALLFRGAATKSDWGHSPRVVDLVVDTRDMKRVLAHEPADMTARVEAGITLMELQDVLEAASQWLAVDPPSGHRGATLGGLIATADSGPRRWRYGAIRDLVIGMTVVLGDGTLAHSGGSVIKNVAGYDLARLFYGSLGTLGLIAEVVVRVHPRPRASRTIRLGVEASLAVSLAMELAGGGAEPSALQWMDGGLLIRVEGETRSVDAQMDALAQSAQLRGVENVVLGAASQDEAWAAIRDNANGVDGDTLLHVQTLPSRLGEVASSLERAAAAAGVVAVMQSSVGLGIHSVRLSGGSAQHHAVLLEAWRSELSTRHKTAVMVGRRIAGLEDEVDLWGPPPSALLLLQRVKRQLDPDDRCAPGRFHPWL